MLPIDYDSDFRYNELLKEAEQYRQAKRFGTREYSVQVRVLQSLADGLISLGKSLKSLSLSL
jgi:hypothetical protein